MKKLKLNKLLLLLFILCMLSLANIFCNVYSNSEGPLTATAIPDTSPIPTPSPSPSPSPSPVATPMPTPIVQTEDQPLQQQSRFIKILSKMSVAVGNLTHYANAVQINYGGKKNTFAWNPFIKFGYNLGFGETKKWSFNPSYTLVYPDHNGDTHTKQFISFTSFDFGYFVVDNLQCKLGAGFFFYNVSGDGETEDLRNGGSTSTFYVPKYSKVSINSSLDMGVGYRILSFLSADLDVYILSLNREVSKQYNYAMSITYYFNHLIK
ncbi:MAG: hypothetical protein HQK49_05190 [Oligoflexia bacterium]|nr:hypothetical protein [Oligoflexia bacterium]